MENNIHLERVEFLGKTTLAGLKEIAEGIKKKMPTLTFQYENVQYKGSEYKDVELRLGVYDEADPHTKLGQLGFAYSKFWVSSPNVVTGRWVYGAEHTSKQSIHPKNITKEAIKSIKPLQFEQAIETTRTAFARAYRDLEHKHTRNIHHGTSNGLYNHMGLEEIERLNEVGYEPVNPQLRQAMAYVKDNADYIRKWDRPMPNCIEVWVRSVGIEWKKYKDKEIHQAKSINDLPEDIRGKMAVVDIMGERQMTEDVGYKESAFYWIFV